MKTTFDKIIKNFSLNELKFIRNWMEVKESEFNRKFKLTLLDDEIKRKEKKLLR